MKAAPNPPPGYPEALERLRKRERYEPAPRSRGPEKLEGILSLLARLGHPERGPRVVHVAGTNGKGTTAAMVAALLRAGGHRCGLYASPHVRDIRERVMVDGALISRANFAEVTHAVLDAAEREGGRAYLSYFDLLTAIGFLAFQRAGVGWAVLEVGLGGRSDATNVTEKELCILTRIGWDHMAVLGNSLKEIAGEKLGIVPPGVPVVIAAQEPELYPWLEGRLAEMGCAVIPPASPAGLPPLPPARLECARAALAAADFLLGPADGEESRRRAAAVTGSALPGRLEFREGVVLVDGGGPPLGRVLLDGGHNPGALAALNAEIARRGLSRYTLVFTLQRDKLVEQAREQVKRLAAGARAVLVPAPQTPRTATAAEIGRWLAGSGGGAAGPPPLEPVEGVRAALLAAAKHPGRPLVAAGSFWMVGDLMGHLALPPLPEADAWAPAP